jgi:hypothetical protein
MNHFCRTNFEVGDRLEKADNKWKPVGYCLETG